MDIFGTTVTVLGEVYKITVFIKEVVHDMNDYPSAKREVQTQLEHERLFLEYFQTIFLDGKEAVLRSDQLHVSLKLNVLDILTELNKTVAEYGLLAAKHGLLGAADGRAPEEQGLGDSSRASTSPSLKERIKKKMDKLRHELDWALFKKEKIEKVLAKYSKWTGLLRQTMSFVLLTISALGKTALADFVGSKGAKDMGLQDVATRQLLVGRKPPADFNALDGRVVDETEFASDWEMRLARYEDDWGRAEQVVVEYRGYHQDLIRAIRFGLPEKDELSAATKELAWLLHKSPFSEEEEEGYGDGPTSPHNALAIFTLSCVGYLDQPSKHRSVFVYRLPRAAQLTPLRTKADVVTLHDWIDGYAGGGGKPTLGNRFFLAHALSLTVLNIHGSGWVHKNIWSRGVAVFPTTSKPGGVPGAAALAPYLCGWGSARRMLAGTERKGDSDPEQNFYRHPVRQGEPAEDFRAEHDIYALGVVLLEIGLWKTVSGMFEGLLKKIAKTGQLPAPEAVREALLEKARDGIGSEMGEAYARSVKWCLEGGVGTGKVAADPGELFTAFRASVLDVVAAGMKL